MFIDKNQTHQNDLDVALSHFCNATITYASGFLNDSVN